MVKLKQIRDIKVVVVGDGAVGKTCLLIRFCEGKFNTEYIPTIFDNKSKKVKYNSKQVGIHLWDTAGQEDYDHLRPLSYPDTDVFILAFSVISPTSYENVASKWYREVRAYTEERANIVLACTKLDLRNDAKTLRDLSMKMERPVSYEQGVELQKQLGAYKYVETSAKTKKNVDQLFVACLDSCFKFDDDGASSGGGSGGGGSGGGGGGSESNGKKCLIL